MKFWIEIDVRDEEALERALHDIGASTRCKMRGIAQKAEFRYVDGGFVRVIEPCRNPHCDRAAHEPEACDDSARCDRCDYCTARDHRIAELAGERR